VSPLEHFRMLAAYNRWANEKLYALCDALPDEERKRDRKAFFHSIHGTLNHLLLGDRAWLGRFIGEPVSFRSLDQELYADWGDLRRERAKTDAAIESFCNGLTEERLGADLDYATQAGTRHRHPLAPALVHLFNHETHHRGQLTTLLMQTGVDPGAIDLIVYYRERGTAGG
jgi:uncharacterized damage-inducible protein DinB